MKAASDTLHSGVAGLGGLLQSGMQGIGSMAGVAKTQGEKGNWLF